MNNIVLLGKPGSGKGTLANQLKDFGYTVLTTGELYRKEAALGTEFGLRAKEYWGKGNLCPDEMTNELMKMSVSRTTGTNLIFDGYPRTVNQARYLDAVVKVDLILDLKVPDEVVIQRLMDRRLKEGRPDDTEEIIKQRLEVYYSNNKDIIRYYAPDSRYKTVDANAHKDIVLSDVKRLLGGNNG